MKRGYFGIGVENLIYEQNLGTLWRSALNLGADFIFTIGRRYKHQASDTVKAERHIPFYEYLTFEDFYKAIPRGCRLIGVEERTNAHNLKCFIHPERAVYLLGAEDHGLTDKALSYCKDVVRISSRFCLNVSVAGAIVMYDRQNKLS